MNFALAVSMFDEVDSMLHNLRVMGKYFHCVEVVQSNVEPYKEIEAAMYGLTTPHKHYTLFPNLDNRKTKKGERFDIGARSMSRNFSRACENVQKHIENGVEIDFVIGITGDTQFAHMCGVQKIIDSMGTADISVSRAMGQNFHRADLTREQMADPDFPKEGRYQDGTVKDFMPQFWIAKSSLMDRLSKIEVTNLWCFEQCIGDAIGDAEQYVFSETAYGFTDGIIYHVPSPAGWKH